MLLNIKFTLALSLSHSKFINCIPKSDNLNYSLKCSMGKQKENKGGKNSMESVGM